MIVVIAAIIVIVVIFIVIVRSFPKTTTRTALHLAAAENQAACVNFLLTTCKVKIIRNH